ncbi:putative rhamnogalacturonan acetyltransferase [Fusarium flagelliforme]|uniref:putative rhamnogalacturonan acetyltransferase n=1 Tax=Fusarium flagelliforme TaxID=2675880 RepID=UPI001E8D0143|nr:putative rhamnogalacturonan acetyltransferase [Fusarium flagelliforme]KAH7174878.1 putative rhamnogalacturonan acetyltransferase [Fusarium flagelliforme]
MKFLTIVSTVLSILGSVQAAKSPFFILTGDSTVATGGGWGDALINGTKKPGGGINLAKNGATTVSFRDQGLWDKALEQINTQKKKHEAIVTIQFGHNDQKTLTLEQYSDNLSTMIGEVKSAGGTAIIITSLTRRTFKDGSVVENLIKERDAAIAVANKAGVQYLDLNTASTKYVNAIGQENADKYNEIEGDRTHLNFSGKIVFGRMVADMLVQKRRDLARYIRSNKKLTKLIGDGVYATGQE